MCSVVDTAQQFKSMLFVPLRVLLPRGTELLHTKNSVSVNRQIGKHLRIDKLGIFACQIILYDPTGLAAAASDINRDLVLDRLPEQFVKGRPAHAVNFFCNIALHQEGRLSHQSDTRLVARVLRAKRSHEGQRSTG